ncbi:Nn.00g081290.m01.CDS01 [Neocucurbitaria sp. VM-36]
MDVFKDTSQYVQTLERQKQVLQKAKKRYGQLPRDRKPREEAYLTFMMALMSMTAKGQRSQNFMVHSSFIPPAYLPCVTPLAELKGISIQDLRLEVHHRGFFLVLRAITPPNRMTGILVLAEDNHDDVVVLQLYQQEEEEAREATDIVDVGTILIVKEPYFKVMASGEYGLRVDHLSDVKLVDENDPRVPESWRPRIAEIEDSAESLKMKGNSAMGDGRYWQAIKEYTNALAQRTTEKQIEVLKRNRALAYLKTKQFDAALLDTGFPNFGPDPSEKPSEKALFRAAEALYFLERFQESYEILELLCMKFPSNKQATIVLDRARKRLSETSTGDYNFKLLQAEAKKLRPPQLDHATYVGPVEIRETNGKGRGLFVTKAVRAGELILCEKAFSHVYAPESDDDKSKMTLLMNTETNTGFMGGQADLIRVIVQKLHRNPSIAPFFTALHHGTYKTASKCTVDGEPIVDTFLAERIMSLNVFGCPRSSLVTHKEAINNDTKEPTAYHSCGIWTQASYINHSCTSNARRSFIGDMMIIRATQDLEPGTELTFWYQSPNGLSGKAMQEKLKSWDFTCTCAICQDEKETKASVFAERRKLMDKLKRACDSPSPHGIQTSTAERLLKALNDTYARPADEVPRLLLWDPQLLLARVYSARDNMTKVLKSVHETLTLLGFIVAGLDATSTSFRVVKWGLMMDHLVEAFLHARTAFEAIQGWENSKRAEEYARTAYKIVVGENTSFESIYGR